MAESRRSERELLRGMIDGYLTIHGAAERTEDEFGVLLAAAGFRMERIVPVLGAMKVIEAVPV